MTWQNVFTVAEISRSLKPPDVEHRFMCLLITCRFYFFCELAIDIFLKTWLSFLSCEVGF